ncbi:MAG: hypothetical protein JRH16_09200 [Deltaproteobacteria bacterium]|nr:hypothetical protein [Deltaproteobacteria bacterium]MBW2361927.1 hypothetical protein [Deltaproteobacteria bacterium]
MLIAPASAPALTLAVPFDEAYATTDLGPVPGVPTSYGGLTLKAGDPNTLLIGGSANNSSGALYEIGVVRDAEGHITGFTGTAQRFADAAYNDGGVTYGPNGVLFTSRWPQNELGQLKPGSTTTDKIIDLGALGVISSHAAINFVPNGFAGAGGMKLSSWSGGQFYSATFAGDGLGTFDVLDVVLETTLSGGPEGFAYVPLGSPLFDVPSMLVSEWSAGKVAAYEVDAEGDPIVGTRVDFITDLSGAEGAFIDPATGDFLFSTFGGGDRVIVVQGFTPVPEPGSAALLASALLALAILRRPSA